LVHFFKAVWSLSLSTWGRAQVHWDELRVHRIHKQRSHPIPPYPSPQAYPGGLQLGGGVTPQNAMEYLAAGASHVIVTSYIFTKEGEEEGQGGVLRLDMGKVKELSQVRWPAVPFVLY